MDIGVRVGAGLVIRALSAPDPSRTAKRENLEDKTLCYGLWPGLRMVLTNMMESGLMMSLGLHEFVW
jgi:hypothetical protein